MSRDRIVDAVYEQLWEDYGRPTHPEDVAILRDTITAVIDAATAYLSEHPDPVRWTEP